MTAVILGTATLAGGCSAVLGFFAIAPSVAPPAIDLSDQFVLPFTVSNDTSFRFHGVTPRCVAKKIVYPGNDPIPVRKFDDLGPIGSIRPEDKVQVRCPFRFVTGDLQTAELELRLTWTIYFFWTIPWHQTKAFAFELKRTSEGTPFWAEVRRSDSLHPSEQRHLTRDGPPVASRPA